MAIQSPLVIDGVYPLPIRSHEQDTWKWCMLSVHNPESLSAFVYFANTENLADLSFYSPVLNCISCDSDVCQVAFGVSNTLFNEISDEVSVVISTLNNGERKHGSAKNLFAFITTTFGTLYIVDITNPMRVVLLNSIAITPGSPLLGITLNTGEIEYFCDQKRPQWDTISIIETTELFLASAQAGIVGVRVDCTNRLELAAYRPHGIPVDSTSNCIFIPSAANTINPEFNREKQSIHRFSKDIERYHVTTPKSHDSLLVFSTTSHKLVLYTRNFKSIISVQDCWWTECDFIDFVGSSVECMNAIGRIDASRTHVPWFQNCINIIAKTKTNEHRNFIHLISFNATEPKLEITSTIELHSHLNHGIKPFHRNRTRISYNSSQRAAYINDSGGTVYTLKVSQSKCSSTPECGQSKLSLQHLPAISLFDGSDDTSGRTTFGPSTICDFGFLLVAKNTLISRLDTVTELICYQTRDTKTTEYADGACCRSIATIDCCLFVNGKVLTPWGPLEPCHNKSGSTGATGPIGPTGSEGATGVTGPSGTVGSVGATGTSGAMGGPGITGSTGQVGATGIQGVPGSTGVSGNMGVSGGTGSTGSTGPTGNIGLTGNTGATGGLGPEGSSGATGATGIAGPTGLNGATGVTGVQGSTGVGELGATGVSGSLGVTGNTGSPGSTGVSGINGEIGSTGVTGATGATGPSGSSGVSGSMGASGVTGPNGSTGVSGTIGMTGATGLQGETGPSGSVGATGPIGNSGVQGNTGPPGASGVGNSAFTTRFGNSSASSTTIFTKINNGSSDLEVTFNAATTEIRVFFSASGGGINDPANLLEFRLSANGGGFINTQFAGTQMIVDATGWRVTIISAVRLSFPGIVTFSALWRTAFANGATITIPNANFDFATISADYTSLTILS